MMNEFDGKRITVMGLGRFGGGAGVTRWLVSQGAHVCISDLESHEKLRDSIGGVSDLVEHGVVELHLGGHDIDDFTNCDLVIANPAVPKPWEDRYIKAAIEHAVPVSTEIQLLAARINRNRTIGITGSAGKSTTSAMIHHILGKCGCRAHLGGNIGGSLLNQLGEIRRDDWVVLELSSAMLHWLASGDVASMHHAGWSPHIAVITNILPNHIDWHGSFEHYRDSKLNILKFQSQGDHAIQSGNLLSDEFDIPLAIPGKHNELNARFAIAAVQCALQEKVGDACKLAGFLADFSGLPHRLQLIASHEGMHFFNDSKSTTPDATILAVAAFDDPARIHLIAGGYDKGSDLSGIAELSQRIAGLYTIGKTGAKLAATGSSQRGFAEYCVTVDRAVELAVSRMRTGDVLLLSPGCASWDQFTNYEERGRVFADLVKQQLLRTAAMPWH